jgi:hypothetical protein
MSGKLELEQDMRELARLCRESGRDAAPVTVFLWELDEAAIERCATAGVSRCIVYTFPQQHDQVEALLERCASLAARFTD